MKETHGVLQSARDTTILLNETAEKNDFTTKLSIRSLAGQQVHSDHDISYNVHETPER